jgi:dephospho-CoA kinase
MENPSAEQAIQIIDDLVGKTFNTQRAFERAIGKLVGEAARIRACVEDISEPLSDSQTRQILQNVSLIIRELGMIEKGFGKNATQAPHPAMTYEDGIGALKQ